MSFVINIFLFYCLIKYPIISRFTKPVNLLMAVTSYLGGIFRRESNLIRAMPVSVSTELTNNCNLRCPECSSGSGQMTRQHGFMDLGLFNSIIDELRPYLYNINLYFQGEPMMHPLFFSFLDSCRGIHSTVSTNGHFLSGENSEKIVSSGLKRLIVSIDGTDQDSYSAYRVNGNLGLVLDGLEQVSSAMVRHKHSMSLEIQFLVNRINEHQIPQVRAMTKSIGAKLTLKSMQVINAEKVASWLPFEAKYRRYEPAGSGYINKNRMPDRCARLWFNPVITWDGKVLPCCFDKDAEHVMGDLTQESFRDIWNGPGYLVFKNAILKDRSMVEICRNCTSGLKDVEY